MNWKALGIVVLIVVSSVFPILWMIVKGFLYIIALVTIGYMFYMVIDDIM